MHKRPFHSTAASVSSGVAVAGQPRPGESEYEYYRRIYRDMPYFSSGRAWTDYAPAYRYAMEQVAMLDIGGASFEAIEARLQGGWDDARDGSRLSWPEARGAVRHVFEDADARRRARAPRRES
ncbi:hypothetical protein E4582_13630 [Luteimonas yindakuii]|uniref:Uncharacterized protein n=1 Tax=Luteimonas yindakuii TaxID=2565782 RepID=A0A4Z1R3U9_9GAMM|nr:hypothetical protein [Luteimonas yindakuii]QCO66703.1 hypothetical protein E5843_00830 [Luteimonas yindakuii]TKS53215.1 hypothetical protein E4582_13630 [Luteimonas yindakuii]